MKFTYNGPEIAVEVFKTVFPKGQAVEVTDENAISKLKFHPEFDGGSGILSSPKKEDPKK